MLPPDAFPRRVSRKTHVAVATGGLDGWGASHAFTVTGPATLFLWNDARLMAGAIERLGTDKTGWSTLTIFDPPALIPGRSLALPIMLRAGETASLRVRLDLDPGGMVRWSVLQTKGRENARFAA